MNLQLDNKNYFDINSQHRNRESNPNPCYFNIPLSDPTSQTISYAYDPVCNAMPIKCWTPSEFNAISFGTTIPLIISHPTASSTDLFAQEITVGSLQNQRNYYVGSVVQIDGTYTRRIVSCEKLSNSSIVKIKLDYPIDLINPGATMVIEDPTEFLLGPVIFVPASPQIIDYYANKYLYNETQNQYRKILGFDAATHCLQISPAPTWLRNDNLCIRNELPSIISAASPASTTTTIFVSIPTLPSNFTTYFIRIRGNKYGNVKTPNGNGARRIIKYDWLGGTNYSVTVDKAFPQPVGLEPFLFNLCEFFPISYDNLIPFTFNKFGEQNVSFYEIKLITLTIPRAIIASGGLISNYSHIYVKFANFIGSGNQCRNNFISNNSNTFDILFKCSLSSSTQLENFFKFDGEDIIQTVQFRPDDTLIFAVKLSNGLLMEFKEADNFSPEEPNALLQVSATFEIRKVSGNQSNRPTTILMEGR